VGRCEPMWSTSPPSNRWSDSPATCSVQHGHVDVLVNNVGDYRPLVRFEESSRVVENAMYDINLFHVFAVTRAFLGEHDRAGRAPSSTSTRSRA
jgi:NAD(P)-dependent dehydrogenase (short-subunit alcohol dehydrogenase family)